MGKRGRFPQTLSRPRIPPVVPATSDSSTVTRPPASNRFQPSQAYLDSLAPPTPAATSTSEAHDVPERLVTVSNASDHASDTAHLCAVQSDIPSASSVTVIPIVVLDDSESEDDIYKIEIDVERENTSLLSSDAENARPLKPDTDSVSYLLAGASSVRPVDMTPGLDSEDDELDTIYRSEPVLTQHDQPSSQDRVDRISALPSPPIPDHTTHSLSNIASIPATQASLPAPSILTKDSLLSPTSLLPSTLDIESEDVEVDTDSESIYSDSFVQDHLVGSRAPSETYPEEEEDDSSYVNSADVSYKGGDDAKSGHEVLEISDSEEESSEDEIDMGYEIGSDGDEEEEELIIVDTRQVNSAESETDTKPASAENDLVEIPAPPSPEQIDYEALYEKWDADLALEDEAERALLASTASTLAMSRKRRRSHSTQEQNQEGIENISQVLDSLKPVEVAEEEVEEGEIKESASWSRHSLLFGRESGSGSSSSNRVNPFTYDRQAQRDRYRESRIYPSDRNEMEMYSPRAFSSSSRPSDSYQQELLDSPQQLGPSSSSRPQYAGGPAIYPLRSRSGVDRDRERMEGPPDVSTGREAIVKARYLRLDSTDSLRPAHLKRGSKDLNSGTDSPATSARTLRPSVGERELPSHLQSQSSSTNSTKAVYVRPPPGTPTIVPTPVIPKPAGALPLSWSEKTRSLSSKLLLAFPDSLTSETCTSPLLFTPPRFPHRVATNQQGPVDSVMHGFWSAPLVPTAGKAVFPLPPVSSTDTEVAYFDSQNRDRVDIFIDNSNVLYSFLNWARARPETKIGILAGGIAGGAKKPLKTVSLRGRKLDLDYKVLFGILERGRKVEKRILVGSSPLWQSLEVAVEWGYEVSVLQRVPRPHTSHIPVPPRPQASTRPPPPSALSSGSVKRPRITPNAFSSAALLLANQEASTSIMVDKVPEDVISAPTTIVDVEMPDVSTPEVIATAPFTKPTSRFTPNAASALSIAVPSATTNSDTPLFSEIIAVMPSILPATTTGIVGDLASDSSSIQLVGKKSSKSEKRKLAKNKKKSLELRRLQTHGPSTLVPSTPTPASDSGVRSIRDANGISHAGGSGIGPQRTLDRESGMSLSGNVKGGRLLNPEEERIYQQQVGYQSEILRQHPHQPTLPPQNAQQLMSQGSKEPRQYKEQAVDELIHLKILESLLDYVPPVPSPTPLLAISAPSRPLLVIATGDANSSEYNPNGFLGCVKRALVRGWDVEIVAFSEGTSSSWRNLKSDSEREMDPQKGKLKVVDLGRFAEELVAGEY